MDKNRDYAQVLEERDIDGNLIVGYIYGDDLISQMRGGVLSYYHYDGQLSVRQLSNADGNISDDYVYDAFGVLLEQSGDTVNEYLYTGEQFDEAVGGYYLRARYYDPGAGRFLSSDPYAGRMNEPVTLHKYLYANANPVMHNDPTGLMSILEFKACSKIDGITREINLKISVSVRIAASDAVVKLGGIGYLSRSGPQLLSRLSGTGMRGVQALQRAFLNANPRVAISQSRASLGVSFGRAKYALTKAGNKLTDIEWHHIVERAGGRNIEKFGKDAMNFVANVVPTPSNIHLIISNFQKSNPAWLRRTGFRTVWQWLESQTWDDAYRYGLDIWQTAMRTQSLDRWTPPF
ncbi:RHS repeat-associated core domain-containing pro tein [Desulfonema ishimotonii]|uniref:RHS repeat-associated core domain-containing pro tein n=1 Tax=Desulfonema ishimotonii TaxID=45657 RepID=A0A401FVJ6_9BACT|nr:RHS repeat-associated core domain-containing protein [Desulfonema ishimotonii]GBC60973.1 RHS repeat-associated core domain-containing pro tein [Desulfonema ishimotonii]